jgi:hypothetical protein
MGANEFHQYAAILIRNANNQLKFITTNVENHAVIGNEIGTAEHGPDIGWTLPNRPSHESVPYP